jgi:putative Mg2+ transporter-C (MgtC) family protein
MIVLSENGEIALRLGAAVLLGSVLGLNRVLHGKPAGLRTHGGCPASEPSRPYSLAGTSWRIKIDRHQRDQQSPARYSHRGRLSWSGCILRDPSGHVAGLSTAATIPVLLLALGGPIEYVAERLLKRRIERFSERFTPK